MLEIICVLIFFLYVIAFLLLRMIQKLNREVHDIYMYLASEVEVIEVKPVEYAEVLDEDEEKESVDKRKFH